VQLFMPYYNLEYTKALTYTMANVAGGIGQGPATEVTHLGLNQLPVFSSILLCLSILDLRSVCTLHPALTEAHKFIKSRMWRVTSGD